MANSGKGRNQVPEQDAPGADTRNNRDFIRTIIDQDQVSGTFDGQVVTRFPPEPNGFLHIGHAKSICLNFGIALEYPGGRCHLRFDDTNPTKEETGYVESIRRDVAWLGFNWGKCEYYASDYFDQLYEYALQLIRAGKAYVCQLNAEQIKEHRGSLTEPGVDSPWRNRPVTENLDLFQRMRAGEFAPGEMVLRAKIDMASPNLNMRDPVIYRIMNAEHHRTGNKWCIYPMYDFTHCLSDSIEHITHSLCTLEFEDHRPLYDWFLDQLQVYHPQQIEFARLNLTHTLLSKRILLRLVEEGMVDGWDDPRMPTISGLRRRGYSPQAIRAFADVIGVAKTNSVVDISLLEHQLREDLNKRALRVMAVLRPLRLVIRTYPEDKVEELEAENNPEDPVAGKRLLPFSRVLYIEQDDFKEEPPAKYFRLAPGREVRLKHAYYVRCEEVVHNDDGSIREVVCSHDPDTRGGWSEDGRKVKGTLHWVSANHALDAEVRLYEHLFTSPNPGQDGDFSQDINPQSRTVLRHCKLEPSLAAAQPGTYYQFLRQGYFCADEHDSHPDAPVFNRTVPLRDSWAKLEKKNKSTKK